MGNLPLVATTICAASVGCWASQRPMISSDTPALYTSAVSRKVPPDSTKVSMIRPEVSSSASAPNVMVPRHWVETTAPLRPRVRYCTVRPFDDG